METIKNQVVNITIGTAIVCLVFMLSVTWKLSSFMTSGNLVAKNQELKISLIENDIESQEEDVSEEIKQINEKVGDLNVGMAQIKTALGIKDK